ncbi:hypothetical protein CEXT_726211 [Caerostris extrusa]|uniref:Uncharacterized protein n=1 Tax=Caerostris extrusa TaxID=172846 RepID=A0AAV4XDC9_CAEEX|nr:hypothetical protein CEXT_726211 [Caerostris extrusa]
MHALPYTVTETRVANRYELSPSNTKHILVRVTAREGCLSSRLDNLQAWDNLSKVVAGGGLLFLSSSHKTAAEPTCNRLAPPSNADDTKQATNNSTQPTLRR